MGIKVRLTWIREEGQRPVVEECTLMHEDDDLFVGGVLQDEKVSMLMKDGRVIFEDAEGLFGLKPKQIVKIEKL